LQLKQLCATAYAKNKFKFKLLMIIDIRITDNKFKLVIKPK